MGVELHLVRGPLLTKYEDPSGQLFVRPIKYLRKLDNFVDIGESRHLARHLCAVAANTVRETGEDTAIEN
eukprot:7321531-Pyramimonas_sp.AAC.1